MKTPIEVGAWMAEWNTVVPLASFELMDEVGIPREAQRQRFENAEWEPRPTPPVELPDKPTWGWVKSGEQGYLDMWHRDGAGVYDSTGLWAQAQFIDSWMPAVAVPKVALDELRAAEHAAHMSDEDGSYRNYARKRAVNTFLTAVDEANRA